MTADEIAAAAALRHAAPLAERRRRRLVLSRGGGPWSDVGEGKCQRCGVVRRLYRPEVDPEIAVCAPCTQALATSAIPNTERESGDRYGGQADLDF